MLERQVQALSLGLLGSNSALSPRSTLERACSKERFNHVRWETAPRPATYAAGLQDHLSARRRSMHFARHGANALRLPWPLRAAFCTGYEGMHAISIGLLIV
jgi:hypothetical protein